MGEKPVVMVLAAGLGTRMKSETAKVLHMVAGRPLVAWAVETAIDEMNAGFYAIRLGVLRAGVAALTSDNAQGELYLTNLAEAAAERGGAAVIEAPFEEIYGINDRVDLAQVEVAARRRINEELMRAGSARGGRRRRCGRAGTGGTWPAGR